jgi:hypothetical protein
MTYAEGVAHDPERGEIFLDPPAYSIMNPVAEGRVNLSLVVPAAEGGRRKPDLAGYFDRTVAAFPHLRDRLRGGVRVSPVRALGPLAYRVEPPRHDGVVLVGDALGFLRTRSPARGSSPPSARRAGRRSPTPRCGPATARPLRSRQPTRRRAAFAAKERVSVLLQRLIVRRWLTALVARRLARHRRRSSCSWASSRLRPRRELLSPRFLARLLP